MPSGFVAADAQFTLANVLKPFPGFETVYQGASHANPVAFPGGTDPRAGEVGISANLIAGHPIPLGARVLVWIPVAVLAPTVTIYEYTFVWRLRNTRDYRVNAVRRPPFHFGKQRPGAPDSSVAPVVPRFVIPAACDVVMYEQAEPAAFGSGVMRVVNQSYRIGDGGGQVEPLLPSGGIGIFQQGVLDPNTATPQGASDPIFQPIWMDAMGDELIILAKPQNVAGNWDFAGTDLPFSNIYGTGNAAHAAFPDVGIYVFTGTNP
jgi:hypothetical protein